MEEGGESNWWPVGAGPSSVLISTTTLLKNGISEDVAKNKTGLQTFYSHLMAMITRAGTETITPTLLINKLTLWSITQ